VTAAETVRPAADQVDTRAEVPREATTSGPAVGIRHRGARIVAPLAVVVSSVFLAVWAGERVHGSGDATQLTKFLLAAAVILAACHALGAVARALRQPAVVGELLGGVLIGPSLLGWVWQGGSGWLFPATVQHDLHMVAELGLVAFMFLVGLELRAGIAAERCHRNVWCVVAGGMGLPVLCGSVVAIPMRHALAGTGASTAEFAIFIGLALSITALPVLARMLEDLDASRTPVAVTGIASAAVGDGLVWGLLSLLLATSQAAGFGRIALELTATAAFLVVALVWLRPLLDRCAVPFQNEHRRQLLVPAFTMGAVGFAAATNALGLHPAVGALLFGVVVPPGARIRKSLDDQLRGFTTIVLLPIFFADVGLNTSVRLVGASIGHWLVLGGVIAVACGSKLLGVAGGARLSGMDRGRSLELGVLMNCRGVTELVFASIGFEYHIINGLGLTVIVLVALVTTVVTGPLLQAIGSTLVSTGRHAGRTVRPWTAASARP
jgi:Kef-type K+ transport system membrane component KefB